MNIFYLDPDPKLAAQYHCDKHVIKMILESAQLLSTAHRVLDNSTSTDIYKKTHQNHPSAVWTRKSVNNYNWLYLLFNELLDEYTFRYNKIHKSSRLIPFLKYAPINISNEPFTPPTLAMPDQYKSSDHVESYRKYYLEVKVDIARWNKTRPSPDWWNSRLVLLK